MINQKLELMRGEMNEFVQVISNHEIEFYNKLNQKYNDINSKLEININDNEELNQSNVKIVDHICNIDKLIDNLIECLKIQNILSQADENDRKNYGLYGVKEKLTGDFGTSDFNINASIKFHSLKTESTVFESRDLPFIQKNKNYLNPNQSLSNNQIYNDSINNIVNLNSSIKQLNKNLKSNEPINSSMVQYNNVNKLKLNQSVGAVKHYKNRRNVD